MSKAADRLREARLFNPSNIASFAAKNRLPDVYIAYRPSSVGRAITSAWQVIRPYKQTDPDAFWSDYGNKTFIVDGASDRAAKLAQAQEWAADQFGITEWAQIPGMGTARFPRPVAQAIKDYLRNA